MVDRTAWLSAVALQNAAVVTLDAVPLTAEGEMEFLRLAWRTQDQLRAASAGVGEAEIAAAFAIVRAAHDRRTAAILRQNAERKVEAVRRDAAGVWSRARQHMETSLVIDWVDDETTEAER